MSTQATVQTQMMAKPTFTPVASGLLQRCTATTECDECRKKREGMLQREAVNNSPTQVVPPIVYEVLHLPGQPLDAPTRGFMESRLGHDFSNVHLHTDAKAAESARAVNALAYTVGRDVVFGAGQYRPRTVEGQKLIAHELTHVVQQALQSPGIPGLVALSTPGDAAEIEADITTRTIIGGKHATGALQWIPALLQRQSSPMTGTSPRSAGSSQPAGPAALPCPSSVQVGTVAQFNHNNLPASDQDRFGTYLGGVSRMDIGPGPDHSGHCMQEHLTLKSNNCPAAVISATSPCSKSDCLPINRFGSAGDALTHTTVYDGPTSFIDLHRTRNQRSLLNGTGVNSCTIECEQTYSCNGTPVPGTFIITRNFVAGTHTKADGTTMPITTGKVTKTAAGGLSRGAKILIGIGSGALVGAGIGALAGGLVGAAIGAGIGAVAGLIGGLLF
jgi:hypothetical protein